MAGRFKKIILAAIVCAAFQFAAGVTAFASEPQFRLDGNSLNLKLGVSAEFVITLINAQGAQVIGSEGFEYFEIVSQNRSTQTSVANGITTTQESNHITVMPRYAGQFVLKAYVQYENVVYETNELTVNVSESQSDADAAPDLFMKTVVSHEEAYLGEKIVVTYELYSRYNIDNFGFLDYIAVDGAMTREVPDTRLRSEHIYLNGERYAFYETMQLIVDPLNAGVCVIPEFNFQVNVLTERGGGFGGIFRSSQPVYMQTTECEILIKPLPSEGRPADFSGIVGELTVETEYSRKEMNYGDSFTIQVSAHGECNLDGLKNLTDGRVPGFSVYETQKSSAEWVEDARYNAKKIFDVILVPEKTGALAVPAISIPYFNPSTGAYEYAEVSGAQISVLGEMTQNVYAGGAPQGGAAILVNQVSYEAPGDYITIRLKPVWIFYSLGGLAAAALILIPSLVFAARRRKRNPELKTLNKKLNASRDVNEAYNFFNSIIKIKYGFSLKASPRSAIEKRIPDASLAEKILEITDFMESPEAREGDALRLLMKKIRGAVK